MDINGKCSSFQSVILELVREELNMMLCEIFQLKEDINFNDYEKLTKIVLREISVGHIQSPHLSDIKAQKYIKILDNMDCHSEKGNGFQRDYSGFNYTEDNNPFSNSPLY